MTAIAGVIWALYGYRSARRLEAAKWLHGIFRDYYVDDRFADVRWLLTGRIYRLEVAPLLQRRLADDEDLNADESNTIRRLDCLLNFFEHLLYLESLGHLSATDREALFGYWFGLMRSSDYVELQRYVERFGYEYLACAMRTA